jgi:hypothetical protein
MAGTSPHRRRLLWSGDLREIELAMISRLPDQRCIFRLSKRRSPMRNLHFYLGDEIRCSSGPGPFPIVFVKIYG